MHVCMGNDVYVCVSILRIFVNILTKMNVHVHPLKLSMDTPPPKKHEDSLSWKSTYMMTTVDGWNPKQPPGMYKTL